MRQFILHPAFVIRSGDQDLAAAAIGIVLSVPLLILSCGIATWAGWSLVPIVAASARNAAPTARRPKHARIPEAPWAEA